MEHTQIHEDLLAVLKPFMRKLPAGFVLTDGTSLTNDLNIDSADMIDLVLELEDRFSIKVEDEQVARTKTFGDLLSVVGELSSANAK